MSFRNYNPATCTPEPNDLTYMNIPRTSLRIRDVIDRAIRGAPIDCPDTSDYFSEHPNDDSPANHRWADMSDHVDAHEFAMEQQDKMSAAARRATFAEQSAKQSTEQAVPFPSDKKAKRSRSSVEAEPAEVD